MSIQVEGESDRQSFNKLLNSWQTDRFLLQGKKQNLPPDITKKILSSPWRQDRFGNWLTRVDGITAKDEFHFQVLPFIVGITDQGWKEGNYQLVKYLIDFALGYKKPDKYINKGSNGLSWCGLIRWKNTEIAGVYFSGINLTGIERLAYSQLLHETMGEGFDCKVPKPLLATTNCYFSKFIHGEVVDDMDIKDKLDAQLLFIRDNLINAKIWDRKIRFDMARSNYIRSNDGRIYNVDPVCL